MIETLSNHRRTRRRITIFLPLALLARELQAQETHEFKFGMVPYQPIQQLVRLYEPIVMLLEKTTGATCKLLSARDFEHFIELGRKEDFDVIGASPHVARLLNREVGYLPLVRATAPLEPVMVVRKDSPLKLLADIRGQPLLVADPLAVHVLIPMRAMREAGIIPGKDMTIIVAGTQRNAIQRVLKGDAPAAIASMSTFGTLPPELAAQMRLLHTFPQGLTPMAYLLHPRHAAMQERLIQSLLAFAKTEAGKSYARAANHVDLARLSSNELLGQDTLVTEYVLQKRMH